MHLRAAVTALLLWTGGTVPSAAASGLPDLVQRVMPSVVSIQARGLGQPKADKPNQNIAFAQQINEKLGSGFVIDEKGIVVTNRHVIDGAYQVLVTTADGSVTEAKIIGQTLGYDIALLKIERDVDLPAIKLADSDQVRVGDSVLAFGNPLGFGESVTAGIVSGLHRDLGESRYDEFIQTDAPINHGNSGGPLLNETGDVIGINTAIYTLDGGSIGLGFAIPANDVRFLRDQVRRYGRLRLGWIGIEGQKVTPGMAAALDIERAAGVIVSGVVDKGPAAAAHLQVGDIIQKVNGEPLQDFRHLNRIVARAVDETLPFEIWRSGRVVNTELTVAEYPQPAWMSHPERLNPKPDFDGAVQIGLQLAAPDEALRREFDLNAEVSTPVVTAVSPDSVAANAGLKKGDVVIKIQMDDVATPQDFQAKLNALRLKGKRSILLFVDGKQGPRWLTLDIG